MGRIQIDIYNKILDMVISKRHKKNVRMIDNITMQREMKEGEVGIDICSDPREDHFFHWISCE